MSIWDAIDSYRNDINKYNSIKVNLNNIVNELSSSKNSLEEFSSTLNESYSLDGNDSILCTKIKNTREDINSTAIFIKNNVLPAVDRAINRCYNRIDELEDSLEDDE